MDFDISEYVHHSMFSGGEMAQVDTLAFETTEEVFRSGVVVGVALAGGENAQFIHEAVNAFARAGEFLADYNDKDCQAPMPDSADGAPAAGV